MAVTNDLGFGPFFRLKPQTEDSITGKSKTIEYKRNTSNHQEKAAPKSPQRKAFLKAYNLKNKSIRPFISIARKICREFSKKAS